MTLTEIRWTLRAVSKRLELVPGSTRGDYTTILETGDLKDAIVLVSKLPSFRDVTTDLLESNVVRSPYGDVELDSSELGRVRKQLATLRQKVLILLETLDDLLPEESPDTFYYSIPIAQGMSVEDLVSEIQQAEAIFKQPMSRVARSHLGVYSTDTGSLVLQFCATVGAGVLLLNPAIRLVAKIYAGAKDALQTWDEHKRKEEELRGLKLENTFLEQHLEITNATIERMLEQRGKEISAEFLEQDGENNHILLTKAMSALMRKLESGVTVRLPSTVDADIAAEARVELLAPPAARRPVVRPSPALTDGSQGTPPDPEPSDVPGNSEHPNE